MGELNEEYGDRVELEISPASTEEGQAAAAKYEFGGTRHGLVAFAPNGDVGFVMPGHNFSKADIQARLDLLLD